MTESEHRMIEILRILNKQKKPTGSKLIATELKNKGFNLGERAVRYHMQILDEKGYTEKMGYSGRQITDLGREKLEKGLIYDQVDSIYSKFQDMIYLTDFDYRTQKGNVVVNTSTVYDEETLNLVKETFDSGLCVSPYVKFQKVDDDKYNVKTICGTTIDGIFLNEGILSHPLYGGLLKIEDYKPTKFVELISYKKTSIPPLDAFIVKEMTSVSDVIETGEGVIPANFRIVPSILREKVENIVNELEKIGIGGVLDIGYEGESTLGIPVSEGMIGIGIIGGVTPFCVAQEQNRNIDIKIAEEIENFSNLKSLGKIDEFILKPSDKNHYKETPFLLSKMLNLIEQVDFDINTKKGNILANISYLDKDHFDKVMTIMEDSYNQNPEYMNPFYKIIDHPYDEDRFGIGTICSLTTDGILIKNGIMITPKYGGLLELSEPPLFIDLISYNGSSIDPHKVFIAKGMTNINRIGTKRIMASIKEIPYVSRDHAVETLETLKSIGLSIYKIGKPRELIYNAKVDNYNFGIVIGSGLNQIAAIKEENIDINVKAMEKLIPFEEMDRI
ncbi:MAG: NrpR regulatory domain-containing protein [Methanobrevibacter sp.]|uniref:DUF128 domain-containing protein n=1 Tax=Methanobrevibacter sp. TaxID=66852 RepID=UPI0026DFBAF9|nr:DUF128 domain-containing protein [Methanobrevibacter sp.]MDO5848561.1 NrpR regulatory domain-containing protein [Methanobrevibacter sp.]